MGALMGGGGGGKGGGSSGGVSDVDAQMAMWALGQNEQAVHNRYQQLGLGKPSGTAAQAAAGGTSLTSAGPSTMEQMDIGTIPTETGGAQGMARALLGSLFNPVNAAGLGPGGPVSQLQTLAGQQQQGEFGQGAAAAGGGGFGSTSGGFG